MPLPRLPALPSLQSSKWLRLKMPPSRLTLIGPWLILPYVVPDKQGSFSCPASLPRCLQLSAARPRARSSAPLRRRPAPPGCAPCWTAAPAVWCALASAERAAPSSSPATRAAASTVTAAQTPATRLAYAWVTLSLAAPPALPSVA